MLSDNIRKYRKENNMSQDELAEKLDVSRQSVSLWENGQTQPTIDNILALSSIFNISADELLGDEKEIAASGFEVSESDKKKKLWIIIGCAAAAIVIIAVVLLLIFAGKDSSKTKAKPKKTKDSSASSTLSESIEENSGTESEIAGAENNSSSTDKTVKESTKGGTATAPQSVPAQTTPPAAEAFDLFTYCKNFAIQKGKLNGDYTIYQQPSNLYGGYDGEYFSISYWGDSNMVEFCLHCPLDNTYSINFYLRMRGGYNGKYEYLSSRYYRSNGQSIRSASGYINPSVFSESYPLSCDSYTGTADKQNDFMEESRIGMCDLIKTLKRFTEVEKMECGFKAFGFSNF